MKLSFRHLLLVALAFVACSSTRAQVVVDVFNRPDSTDMSPNWIEEAGDVSIVNGVVRGTELSLITWAPTTTTNAISADVQFNPSGTQYIALVLGYANLANNLFVKVQSNSGGNAFDSVFFYYGNNGSSFGAESAFTGITPFASGRIALTLAGSVATLTIDSNFDGIIDQTITRLDVPTALLGSKVGLGFYGAATADNFALAAIPEPGTSVLLCVGTALLLGIGYWRRK